MRAMFNKNYKNLARMHRAQTSKENNTENAGLGPKTNAQYCREYRQRKRALTTQNHMYPTSHTLTLYSINVSCK